MNEFLTIVGGLSFAFCYGYDISSYNIMRKVDKLYKKRNKWFIGYNTYRIWKLNRKNI